MSEIKLSGEINSKCFDEGRDFISALCAEVVRNRLDEFFEEYKGQAAFISTHDNGQLMLACSDFASEFGNPDGDMCYHKFEHLLDNYLTHDGENLEGFIYLLRKYADKAEAMLNDTQ